MTERALPQLLYQLVQGSGRGIKMGINLCPGALRRTFDVLWAFTKGESLSVTVALEDGQLKFPDEVIQHLPVPFDFAHRSFDGGSRFFNCHGVATVHPIGGFPVQAHLFPRCLHAAVQLVPFRPFLWRREDAQLRNGKALVVPPATNGSCIIHSQNLEEDLSVFFCIV